MAHGALALRAVRGGTLGRSLGWPSGHGRGSAAVLLISMLAVGVFALAGVARAQSAAETLKVADAAYLEALTTEFGRAPTPDDGVWRAAIDAAEQAGDEAARELDAASSLSGPGSTAAAEATAVRLEALALAARVYGSVRWHSRAHAKWEAYVAEGGKIQDVRVPPVGLPEPQAAAFPTDIGFATTALSQLAFARYEAGDHESARSYYTEVLDLAPADPEALRWLARMAFEEGDTATAIAVWAELVQVAPDDEGARFFLELSKERDAYGAAASEAYRAGIRAYENGVLQSALESFEAAYAANPQFPDAAVWAARSAFELGRPAVAEPYWEAALAADPADARSAWFLEVTRAQRRWGVAAANDFYAGQTAYADGDLDLAEALFVSAVERNPTYVDAWVWAARSSQEAGRASEAIGYWQEVLRLDPNDDRARYFLQVARQQLAFGPEAGNAFVRGMDAYQAGDVEGARSGFTDAVEAAPTFAAAWGQLGRLEFQVGEFGAAARAYGHALELEPASDEYAFFAAEARRLAGLDSTGAEPVDPGAEADAPDGDEDAAPEQDPGITPLPPAGPGADSVP